MSPVYDRRGQELPIRKPLETYEETIGFLWRNQWFPAGAKEETSNNKNFKT